MNRQDALWCLVLAYAMGPEPSLLINLAEALKRAGAPGEAWLLYSDFLAQRSDSPLYEQIELIMRDLTPQSDSSLRTPSARQRLRAERVQRGKEAQRRGLETAAQREFGIAYALDRSDVAPLALMAKSLEAQRKWSEAYALWQQVEPGPTSLPAARSDLSGAPASEPGTVASTGSAAALSGQELRTEARRHLRELTYVRRPSHYPYFDLQIGAALGGRLVEFTDPRCAKLGDYQLGSYDEVPCSPLRLPITAGPLFSASLFPLAAVGHRAVRGLGLTARLRAMPDATMHSDQLRFESGLLWDLNLLDSRDSPHVQLRVEYGYDRLKQAAADLTARLARVPDLAYQYLSVGGRATAKLLRRGSWLWSAGIGAQLLILLDLGVPGRPETAQYYGPIARPSAGARLELTLARVQMDRGLYLTVDAQFDLRRLDFINGEPPVLHAPSTTPPIQYFIAPALTDFAYETKVALGYAY